MLKKKVSIMKLFVILVHHQIAVSKFFQKSKPFKTSITIIISHFAKV